MNLLELLAHLNVTPHTLSFRSGAGFTKFEHAVSRNESCFNGGLHHGHAKQLTWVVINRCLHKLVFPEQSINVLNFAVVSNTHDLIVVFIMGEAALIVLGADVGLQDAQEFAQVTHPFGAVIAEALEDTRKKFFGFGYFWHGDS